MKINKIQLRNIRSYTEEEIEFPEGSILLSGDIGAGKTSILLGIEFALFGLQPGQKGSSILKNGEKEGSVLIDFEVDGREIIIERFLKRAKTISQDRCSITINGIKKEISVSELKNKVLEILNYPLEFSKKQNLLYKFTVYTPQEEMKQIILQDPATRINTLRHVFGIDKYKRILENASILAAKLREEKRVKEAMTSNLDKEKSNLISKQEDLKKKNLDLEIVEKDVSIKKQNRMKIQEEKEEISKKIEEKNKFQQEIEKMKIVLSNKRENLLNNSKLVEQINSQIAEIVNLKFEESELIRLEKNNKIFSSKKEELNEKIMKLQTQIHSLSLKNSENEDLRNKLNKMDLCPTCLQNVDAVYKSNVANKADSEISANIKKIKELALEKETTSKEVSEINSTMYVNEKQIQDLRMLKIKYSEIDSKRLQLKNIEDSNSFLKKDIEMLEKQIESLKNSVFEFSKYDSIFEEKKRFLEEALVKERSSEIKVAELKKEVEFFSKTIEELKEKIQKTEDLVIKLNYINDLENWISKNFIPLISIIEQNVMVKLKSDFSDLFNEWFSVLVSDTFNVRLSEDFTPIIEQQDYEIDYAYLSGGERTAVALAYRLSLNQVINSRISQIKTKDFVILDEPTDGFSDQQLDKMRDVLQELNVKQLIIVSHEKKIEGFVENVLRLKKEHGISKKEQ